VRQLARLIGRLPCGRVVFDARDSSDHPLGVLDPIDDPAGGYLGVYGYGAPPQPGSGPTDLRVVLGRSGDLLHWRQLTVLDPDQASMPALIAVPAGGFLLAYEKGQHGERRHFIRLRYYRSRAALLHNRFAAQLDLPRRLSAYNNGTPSFLSVAWPGRLGQSVIRLAFHYQPSRNGIPLPDREAIGTVRGWRTWSAHPDLGVDGLLTRSGFAGNHGDQRQFGLSGALWRIYEAQRVPRDFATWSLVVLSPPSRDLQLVTLHTSAGAFTASFGNPVAAVLRAPTGTGQVLAVSTFVFGSAGNPIPGGELLFYQPLSG